MNKDVEILFAKIFELLLFVVIVNGCFLMEKIQSQSDLITNKYYIGRADTKTFQKIVEKVLLDFNYHIKEYDNGPTSSLIGTQWKINDVMQRCMQNAFCNLHFRCKFAPRSVPHNFFCISLGQCRAK